jgi:hypothetical protein
VTFHLPEDVTRSLYKLGSRKLCSMERAGHCEDGWRMVGKKSTRVQIFADLMLSIEQKNIDTNMFSARTDKADSSLYHTLYLQISYLNIASTNSMPDVLKFGNKTCMCLKFKRQSS